MALKDFEYCGLVILEARVFGVQAGCRKYAAALRSTLSCAAASAIAAANRGLMSNPLSAIDTAGGNRSRHAVLPCFLWTACSSRTMPGTPMDRPEARVLGLGSDWSESETQR